MHKSGQAFVPKDRMNYAGRVAATYLRKKVYRWEDRAALANYRLLQAANRDIRDYGLQTASRRGITTISNDAKSIPFRRDLVQYSSQRLYQYSKDAARQSFKYAATAYAAGWYGTQWMIDQAMHEEQPKEPDPIPYLLLLWAILHPGTVPNLDINLTYEDLATEWEDAYTTAVLNAIAKEKRVINSTVIQDTELLALLQQIAAVLGVDVQTAAGLYYSTDLLTRTAIMRALNQSSAAVYQSNAETIQKVMWVTSHDSRVCPECASHDGELFEITPGGYVTPLQGLPPDASHPNCRCTTVPILPDVENPNAPPNETFNEWTNRWMNGNDKWYTLELGEFMNDSTLESTQL